jgi:hypothetical protein
MRESSILVQRMLTVILKALIPDCQIIIAPNASRDVTNAMEMPTLSDREPKHDMSKDDREILSHSRMIEERGRRTSIKKHRDLQHILDHRAERQMEIKLGS